MFPSIGQMLKPWRGKGECSCEEWQRQGEVSSALSPPSLTFPHPAWTDPPFSKLFSLVVRFLWQIPPALSLVFSALIFTTFSCRPHVLAAANSNMFVILPSQFLTLGGKIISCESLFISSLLCIQDLIESMTYLNPVQITLLLKKTRGRSCLTEVLLTCFKSKYHWYDMQYLHVLVIHLK